MSLFGYDDGGRLTSTTDALDRTKSIDYDRRNRTTGETWRDAAGTVVNVENLTYDAAGNVLTAADAGSGYIVSVQRAASSAVV